MGSSDARAGQAAAGFVLATNYLFLDAATVGFWNHLHAALNEHGLQLVMLSSTDVSGADFSVVPIPYQLAGFAHWYPHAACANNRVPRWAQPLARAAACWDPSAPPAAVEIGLARAFDFYGDLIDTLQPCAVLAWNGMHPQTQLLLALARLNGIPGYAAERGWLRGTMMFDLGENSVLTEWSQSVALQSLLAEGTDDGALYESLRAYALRDRAGKYGSAPMRTPAQARAELGLAADVPVLALFTHAEPGIHAPNGALRPAAHAASPALLDELLGEAAAYAARNGLALLIQEHPINRSIGVTRRFVHGAHVKFVESNIHTLLELADITLHTASTVQFDAVFYGRPLVLLGRSLLSLAAAAQAGAYERPDFTTLSDCLDAARARVDWPQRHAALARWVACLARRQLIDVDTGIVPQGAAHFAQLLARFARSAPADLDHRIDAFLATWRRE
jgi:hypothetical protein